MSFWTTTKRVARYGLIGFVRNGFISLAAILILTVTLLTIATLMIGGAALSSVLKDLTDKVDVTVYLAPSATQDQVDALTSDLKALPQVAGVTYISQDEALAQFQQRHQNDQLVMQALQELGENPLGASLQVRAKETAQYEAIAQFLGTQQKNNTAEGQAIDTVNFFQNKTAIDRLTNVIETSRELGTGLAIVLAVASVLIAFNTIRLAIYTARDEISVMNLVGASPWFVRGPFMIAGVLYGVVSGLFVMLLLYPITLSLGPGSQQFLGSFNVYTYYIDHFPVLFLILIGSGVALGALSSFLAVRRYLR
jgi:cell division transport system permease protein